jgi:hypothetical protein
MPHMKPFTGWIRKHVEHIELRSGMVVDIGPEHSVLDPVALPALFDLCEGIRHGIFDLRFWIFD